MIASSPRHEMEVHVRLGADKDGIIQGIDVYTLSNTGAFGEHGPTTVGLSGHKSIPLYGKAKAFRFAYDVVYTNVMSAGAYRGYGATQGLFAVESAVNELAEKMNMDPVTLREKNMVRQGQVMPAYYGETANSCALDRCMEKAKEMGAGALAITGNIDFYGKSGFVPAKTKGVRYADDPVADYFLICELEPGFLNGISGTYQDPAGYFVCEQDPAGFAQFEATFPAKQKQKLPGQLF